MKITFDGWSRSVYQHEHNVRPTTGFFSRSAGKVGTPLKWNTGLSATGMIKEAALNGDFAVRFDFDEEELRNWLTKYVEEKPEEALKLLAEMQVSATIALIKTPLVRKE